MKRGKSSGQRGGCLVFIMFLIVCAAGGFFAWNGSLRNARPETPVETGQMVESAEITETMEVTEAEDDASTWEGTDEAGSKAPAQEGYEWRPYYMPDMQKSLPTKYDPRELNRPIDIKDQGELGTCWAFAALTALESTLDWAERLDFSEDHMSNNPNFILGQLDGGEYTMALAYLLSWQGPVLEEQDPYGDGYSPEGLSAVRHLQEAQFLPEKDYLAIKSAVYQCGGVQSSLHTQLKNADSESRYYNKENAAYCYDGDQRANHETVIVGWDDEYPKENFSIDIPGDGAFLCVNSWGIGFGEQGFFYVSYYDTNIGLHNVVYTRLEAADNYDQIYQSDLCGFIGTLGYGEDEAWAANVYQAEGGESLRAVGFYMVGEKTSYELYVLRQAKAQPDFSRRQLVGSGDATYSGYYTVPLEDPILLEKGERFAVIVRFLTSEAIHPIAIEYDPGDGKSRIDLTDGEGYISLKGDLWESAEESQQCNLCLKAYTDRN